MRNVVKLLFVVIPALIVAGCVTTHAWEYRTRTTNERIGKTVLDEYGSSGWELVQFERIPVMHRNAQELVTTNMMYEYIFKRPKQ